MFRISIAEPDEIKQIEAFLKEKQKEFETDKLYMVSHEDGLAGLGIFSFADNYAVIDDIILRNEQDVEMNHFIVQAIVNKVDYMGYRKIYCSNKRLIPYLNKFVKSDLHEYTYMADLTEYFKHSCQNQHKNN